MVLAEIIAAEFGMIASIFSTMDSTVIDGYSILDLFIAVLLFQSLIQFFFEAMDWEVDFDIDEEE